MYQSDTASKRHFAGDWRSWDVRSLFVCDGSVFPTNGGVNPHLTIQALALRTADRIQAMARRGEL